MERQKRILLCNMHRITKNAATVAKNLTCKVLFLYHFVRGTVNHFIIPGRI